MERILKVIVVLSVCAIVTCCSKYCDSRSCMDKYPDLYNPYTPSEYAISWTDYNSLLEVQRYFLYHDSTVSRHDGDTIMLYGNVTNILSYVPRAGDSGFYLTNDENGGYGEDCFRMVEIGTPAGILYRNGLYQTQPFGLTLREEYI